LVDRPTWPCRPSPIRACSASTADGSPKRPRRDARVGWALAEELNRRLYETLQQTAINTFGSVKQRVAAALLDLASAQQRPQDRLVAQVSQQELADAVGSVREVVARALRDFRLSIVDPIRLHDQSWSAAAE
jgi:CRP/FNR family transcriptional regulator, cyclic AMP receptor protein